MKNSIKKTILILIGICLSVFIFIPNTQSFQLKKLDNTGNHVTAEDNNKSHLSNQKTAYIIPGIHLLFTKSVDN